MPTAHTNMVFEEFPCDDGRRAWNARILWARALDAVQPASATFYFVVCSKLYKIGKAFMHIRQWNNMRFNTEYYRRPRAPHSANARYHLELNGQFVSFKGSQRWPSSAMQWMTMCNAKLNFDPIVGGDSLYYFFFSLLSLWYLCSHVSGSYTFTYIYLLCTLQS